MGTPDHTRHYEYEDWLNQQTATVDRWLMRPRVEPLIRQLVTRWNDLELLGIDLADQLQKLVVDTISSSLQIPDYLVASALGEVSWNQLAEQYALKYTGVEERELVERRLAELRRLIR